MESSNILVRKYAPRDLDEMIRIWNEIVAEGNAFPQEKPLDAQSGENFFGGDILRSRTERRRRNSRAVYTPPEQRRQMRSHLQCELLVRDCIAQAGALGFWVLQFNAVVESNVRARKLYEKLGFVRLGTIPRGFRMKDGSFENICPYYIELN